MSHDYETSVKNNNAADAQALSSLLNLPVTVDRNGMARINAAELLKILSSISR